MSMMMPDQPPATIQIPNSDMMGGDQGGGQGESDPIQFLKDAIAAMQGYQGVEPDAEDKSMAAKILSQIHDLLAKDQQDGDKALGGQLTPRLMRKRGLLG